MPARVEDMLLDGYRDSEDAYMMDLPIERLFFHRESLGALGAAANRRL